MNLMLLFDSTVVSTVQRMTPAPKLWVEGQFSWRETNLDFDEIEFEGKIYQRNPAQEGAGDLS